MNLTSCIPGHWNEEQKTIWNNFENHWKCLLDGNVKEFLKYIHPDFIGYGHESPFPVDKPWLEKWVGFWAKSIDIAICELRPVDIKIHGDIAILQYHVFTIEKAPEGSGKHTIRRYTMTWKKQENRWVVIGSHNDLVKQTS